jgi:hypothetical protein
LNSARNLKNRINPSLLTPTTHGTAFVLFVSRCRIEAAKKETVMEDRTESNFSVFARWAVLIALMICCWPGVSAHAAIEPHTTAISFEKALYSGQFNYQGSPFLLEVGTITRSDADTSRFAANITKGGNVVATCKRTMSGEFPYDVNSMTLKCQGSLFKSKSPIAKFYFGDITGKPQLTLQDGKKASRPLALN